MVGDSLEVRPAESAAVVWAVGGASELAALQRLRSLAIEVTLGGGARCCLLYRTPPTWCSRLPRRTLRPPTRRALPPA